MKIASVLLSVLILVICAFSGCGSEPGSETGQKKESNAKNGDSSAKKSPEPNKVADSVKKWDRSNAKDAEIPDDLPVYEKAKPMQGVSSDVMFVMNWQTKAGKDKVMEFYRKALPEKEWKITSDLSHGKIEASKDRKKLVISIASGTNQPTSIIVRLAR